MYFPLFFRRLLDAQTAAAAADMLVVVLFLLAVYWGEVQQKSDADVINLIAIFCKVTKSAKHICFGNLFVCIKAFYIIRILITC